MGYFSPIPGLTGRFTSHLEIIATGSPMALTNLRLKMSLHNESIKQQITRLKKTKPRSYYHAESIKKQLAELAPLEHIKCYADTPEGVSIPPGCFYLCEKLENPEVILNPHIDIKWVGHERPYQVTGIQNILKHKRGTLQIATGTGKSLCARVLCRTFTSIGKRVLVVVPSIELLKQTFFPLKDDGTFTVSMLGGGQIPKLGVQVVVSTMQSAVGMADQFDVIVQDECFVAGTMVGDKRIEDLQPGDLVPSFCEHTKKVESKRVVAVSKRPVPVELVVITTDSGKQIVCTRNHPFFTHNGEWITAENLKEGCCVSSVKQNMQGMRQRVSSKGLGFRTPKIMLDNEETGLVLEKMCVNDKLNNNEPHERQDSSNAQRTHDNKQSNEGRVCSKISFRQTQRDWALPQSQGWKRVRLNKATGRPRRVARKKRHLGEIRSCNQNQGEGRIRVSRSLQGRHLNPRSQNCDRSRWFFARNTGPTSTGSQENLVLGVEGVSRIEILKQGDHGRFEQLCPDGFVYNLEVEDFHTYFANGIAVHNCQHVSCKTQQDLFAAAVNCEYVYGLSASPWRADGMTQLIWNFTGPIGFKYTGAQAIADGYLSPLIYMQKPIPVTKAPNPKSLPIKKYIALHSDNLYISHVEKYAREALDKGRKVLVLFKSTQCCKKLGARLGVKSADGEYRAPFYAFKKGESNICIANTSLLGEGIDVPDISAILYCAGSVSEISVVQAFGRGTRLSPGKKNCIILDLYPNLPDWRYKAVQRGRYYRAHFETLDNEKPTPNLTLVDEEGVDYVD